jgi:hypothetical protein
MHLRDYGYNTKANCGSRWNAIKYAIDENDAQVVYERLVKLGKFNPVMEGDAESVALNYDVEVVEEEEAEVEASEKAVEEASEKAVVEASEEVVVGAEAGASEEAVVEPKHTRVAMKPEVDKGVRLSKSCKNAPIMKTHMGNYDLNNVAHVRLQLLQDLADKQGIFAVLSLMATHLVTLTNPDQQKIMKGDMSALTKSHNEKMKAEGGPDAEIIDEPEVAKAEREEVMFLEMLDTKLADYKRQLCGLLDSEDLDNNCILAFKSLRENMVSAYNEKIMKNKKIMEQKVEDFGKIARNLDKYRDKIVGITKDYEYKRYTMLRDILFEMSKEEEPVLQDTKQCIVAVLKEHKQCQIVSVSELEKRKQCVLQETIRLMNEIEGQVSRKGAAVKKCDLEDYDILVNAILENYKKGFAGYISALILDLRVKEAKRSISDIPSPDLF